MGVPEEIKDKALNYLDSDLRAIYDEWSEFIGNEGTINKLKLLTKYIGKISEAESYGEWFIDKENDGTPDHPIQMPFVNFDDIVNLLLMIFTSSQRGIQNISLQNMVRFLKKTVLNGMMCRCEMRMSMLWMNNVYLRLLWVQSVQKDSVTEHY